MPKIINKIKLSGRTLSLYIYPPKGQIKSAVLFCHGFPGKNRLPKLAPILSKTGHVLIELNYSGDKASTGTFSFIGCSKDIIACAKFVRRKYPKLPIIGLGYSAGGMYLVNSLGKTSQFFDKLVLLCPAVNPDFFLNSHLMDEIWPDAGKILRLRNKAFYHKELKRCVRSYNPMRKTSSITTPLTLVFAEREQILSNQDMRKFFQLIKGKKQLLHIPNASHELRGNEKEIVKAIIGR